MASMTLPQKNRFNGTTAIDGFNSTAAKQWLQWHCRKRIGSMTPPQMMASLAPPLNNGFNGTATEE
jgi:hypothetical protein